MDAPDISQMIQAGWRLVDAGNRRGGAMQFKAALALDPNNDDALIGLAQAQLYLGEFGEARETCAALLRVAPNDATSHRLMAETLRCQGQYWHAVPVARQAVALDPEEPVGYRILAHVYRGATEHKAALATSEQGLALAPGDADLYAHAAAATLELKGPKAAQPLADEALKLNPDSSVVLRFAARVALARNDLAKARDLLSVLLRRNANDEDALSLYLLTDPGRHSFVRGRMQRRYWRIEHGVWGIVAVGAVYGAIILVVLPICLVTNVPGLVVGVAVRFFMKAQYDAHRREVKAHFATQQLSATF